MSSAPTSEESMEGLILRSISGMSHQTSAPLLLVTSLMTEMQRSWSSPSPTATFSSPFLYSQGSCPKRSRNSSKILLLTLKKRLQLTLRGLPSTGWAGMPLEEERSLQICSFCWMMGNLSLQVMNMSLFLEAASKVLATVSSTQSGLTWLKALKARIFSLGLSTSSLRRSRAQAAPCLRMRRLRAVGRAKTPPVPMKRGLRDGIWPQRLVSPADRKFFPEEESSSMLIVCLLSSPPTSGRLFVITSQIVSFWNSSGNSRSQPWASRRRLTFAQVAPDSTQRVLLLGSMSAALRAWRLRKRHLLSNFSEMMIFSRLVMSSMRTMSLQWYRQARERRLASSSLVVGERVRQWTSSFRLSLTVMAAQQFWSLEFILLISTFLRQSSSQRRKPPPRRAPQKTMRLRSFSRSRSMMRWRCVRRQFMKLMRFSRVLVRYFAKYSRTLLQKNRELIVPIITRFNFIMPPAQPQQMPQLSSQQSHG